jgi:hypothetical protein
LAGTEAWRWGLGSATKDAAKVVFAELRSVQRFSKLASNGPFGHLAQTPKVIGLLAPQSAAELLVVPSCRKAAPSSPMSGRLR